MAERVELTSFPTDGLAVVLGATGGLGQAFMAHLDDNPAFAAVQGYGRSSDPPLDLREEESIAAVADRIKDSGAAPRLIIDATGFLHGDGFAPERSWREITPEHMAHAFAVNAFGPALLMKHLLPLLPREGKAVFATLSAKVGSIGDNQIGGWYSYRASKAALNQFLRCAAIEMGRRRKDAVCVALHPGTVDTGLSQPFAKTGLDVAPPDVAAGRLLAVLDGLAAADTGGFFNYRGEALPW